MLTVTENAQALVQGLAADAGLPDGGGVRLALADSQDQLEASLVAGPEQGDQIVDNGAEAKVYLSPEAAVALDDQALDTTETPQGGVGFTLTPRQSDA